MPFQIVTNAELDPWIMEMIEKVDCKVHLWREDGSNDPAMLTAAEGFFGYGHPIINGTVMDTMPNQIAIEGFKRLIGINRTSTGIGNIIDSEKEPIAKA